MRLAGPGSLADWRDGRQLAHGESEAEAFWREEAGRYRAKHAKTKAELDRLKARISELPEMMREFVNSLNEDPC